MLGAAVLAALATGWAAGIIAAPLVRTGAADVPGPRLVAWTYVVGAMVCHQRPERSFHMAGAQMPVCARCTALYVGGAAGLVGWLALGAGGRRRRATRAVGNAALVRARFTSAILVLGVPIVVSVAAAALGVWDASNALRASLSAPLGVALGAALAAVTLGDLR